MKKISILLLFLVYNVAKSQIKLNSDSLYLEAHECLKDTFYVFEPVLNIFENHNQHIYLINNTKQTVKMCIPPLVKILVESDTGWLFVDYDFGKDYKIAKYLTSKKIKYEDHFEKYIDCNYIEDTTIYGRFYYREVYNFEPKTGGVILYSINKRIYLFAFIGKFSLGELVKKRKKLKVKFLIRQPLAQPQGYLDLEVIVNFVYKNMDRPASLKRSTCEIKPFRFNLLK